MEVLSVKNFLNAMRSVHKEIPCNHGVHPDENTSQEHQSLLSTGKFTIALSETLILRSIQALYGLLIPLISIAREKHINSDLINCPVVTCFSG